MIDKTTLAIVLGTLKEVEWGATHEGGWSICPCCYRRRFAKASQREHDTDCHVKVSIALLEEARKRKP